MPDEHVVRPGVRFRCTACRFVFALAEIPQLTTQPIMPVASRVPRPQPSASSLPAGAGFVAQRSDPPATHHGFHAPISGSTNRAALSSVDAVRHSMSPRGGTEPAGLPHQPLRGSTSASLSANARPGPELERRLHPERRPSASTSTAGPALMLGADQSVLPSGFQPGFDSGASAAVAASSTPASAQQRVDPSRFDGHPGFDSIRSAPAGTPVPSSGPPASLAGTPVPSSGSWGAPQPAPALRGYSHSASVDAALPVSAANPEFRVSDMSVEAEPLPASGHIDPMVEFNDLFQEIRRAEKGDTKRASERYIGAADLTDSNDSSVSGTSAAPSALRASPAAGALSASGVLPSSRDLSASGALTVSDAFALSKAVFDGLTEDSADESGDQSSETSPLAAELTVPRATFDALQRAPTPTALPTDLGELGAAPAPGVAGADGRGHKPPTTGLFTVSELAGRGEGAASTPESGPTDDSVLLQLALTQSGLREPTADAEAATVIDMDASGDSSTQPALFPKGGTALAGVLVVVFCVLGTALYTASRNGWLLDLGDPGQMLAVAFQGAEYTPRHTRVIRVEAGVETEAEGPVVTLGAGRGLAATAGDGGIYSRGDGQRFAVVNGRVTNGTDNTYRGVMVEVSLRDAMGEIVHSRRVPAGAPLEQPALESASGDLEAEYAALHESASEVRLEPGQETVFTGAFSLAEGESAEGLTYVSQVVTAEREVPVTWRAVTFSADQVTVVDEGPAQAGE